MDDSKAPIVNLGKETRRDIAGAIRELSRQFREQRDEKKTRSFADNIAHGIATGGSISGSVKDAVGVSAEKAKDRFKKAIDPVQIVKRLTGSKLATVLAGKALGRNPTKVRSIADIPEPFSPEQQQQDTSPTPYTTPQESPSQVGSEKNSGVFADMLKYMGLINLQVASIAKKLGANVGRNAKGQFNKMNAPQEKILADIQNQLILSHTEDKAYQQHDADLEEEQAKSHTEDKAYQQHDADLEEEQAKLLRQSDALQKHALEEAERAQDRAGRQGHPDESPSQIGRHGLIASMLGKGAGHKDEGSGIFGGLARFGSSALGLGGAAAAAGGLALKAIRHPIKALKSVAGAAGKFLAHPIETTKAAVSAIKTMAGIAPKAAAAVGGIAPKAAEAITKAPGVVSNVAKGGKKAIGSLVTKLMPGMMKKYGGKLAGSLVPGIGTLIGAGMTVGSLLKGDWIGAGLNAVGMIPYAGLATIPAAIAREVYSDVYDGADPFTDPLRAERMPELLASVREQVGNWISGKEQSPTQVADADKKEEAIAGTSPTPTTTPTTPTTPTPMVDAAVAAAKEPAGKLGSEGLWEKFEREERSSPTVSPVPPKIGGDQLNALSREQVSSRSINGDGSVSQSPPVVMNSNPTTNITNQMSQKMGSTRNTDSSFLRRQDASAFAT
jgi:hypothetical protein